MYHDPDFDHAKTKAWQEHVSWGHVVVFRFPIRLPGENEKAKARPCLILETLTIGLQRYAVVAYGTSADSNANRGYDIDARGADAASAGLDRDTRFVGIRRITVPLDHPGFVLVGRSGSPVIGRLSGKAFGRMNAVRARICAEADIAADRRAERRRERPRRAKGKPFVIVRKSPKRLAKLATRTGG